MSLQRKRGEPATFYPTVKTTDMRGDVVYRASAENAVTVRVAAIPDRSSRAEVPGQQAIDVNRLILPAELPGVDLWSRVHWRGLWWDVIGPFALHGGTRHVRHWSVLVRRRPDQDGGNLA